MFSFLVPPSFATILHEINSLPDVPGVGIDALLPREPFYLRRYVLSSTIRGDTRVLSTALVAHIFDEIRRQLRINMRFCAPSRSTLDGRAVHPGPELKIHAREMHTMVFRKDEPHALPPRFAKCLQPVSGNGLPQCGPSRPAQMGRLLPAPADHTDR